MIKTLKSKNYLVEKKECKYRYVDLKTNKKSIWYYQNYDIVLNMYNDLPDGFDAFCRGMLN